MHILLVEDEYKTAEYLKRGLEESDYAVEVAYAGDEALAMVEVSEFDLIILDVMLPGGDGLAVCRALRKRKFPTPILMLTARDGVEDRITGLDAGADDYLVKPFVFKELEARMRALLRRTAQSGLSPVITVGDLSFDAKTREVTRAGAAIGLTVKETAILECLVRDKERVFTREQIAEHVWGMDAPLGSNVVDVYIRNLRRKIDDASPRKLIQTVKGLGYRITEKFS